MKLIWQSLFSPKLHKIYKDGPSDTVYQPQTLEKLGDKIISSANMLVNVGLYASPFICMYIYRRGFFSRDETRFLVPFFGGIGCLIALSFIMRGVGRAYNPKYVTFLKAFTSPLSDKNVYLESIRKYDFEFHAWPVTYALPAKKSPSILHRHPFRYCANANLPFYRRTAIQVLAFFVTHTFGLRLIYPGSLGVVQNMLATALFQGRTQLVEIFEGKRTKIGTADGNTVDTMFIDNRTRSSKGGILVICCEGNSGFYEIGIMITPFKAGYSALGWNHPGFAGSTGRPYPSQEQNAIDAVIQFSINDLGFKPQNIVMFGWSIGGYTASWAAVNYPEIKALVMDATFDDLLPLAQNQMPPSWSLLVKEVVRSYVDLNIAELVTKYPGPVQLVRRTEDEIICLSEGQLSSNRGNHLLVKLVETRHPDLDAKTMAAVRKYVALLESQRASLEHNELDVPTRTSLRLISKYMRDYKSTHCTPLPEENFKTIIDNIKIFKKKNFKNKK